eukprot:921917-Prorocentrum_minimum.AAC.2
MRSPHRRVNRTSREVHGARLRGDLDFTVVTSSLRAKPEHDANLMTCTRFLLSALGAVAYGCQSDWFLTSPQRFPNFSAVVHRRAGRNVFVPRVLYARFVS